MAKSCHVFCSTFSYIYFTVTLPGATFKISPLFSSPAKAKLLQNCSSAQLGTEVSNSPCYTQWYQKKKGFFLSPALTCDLSKLASSPGLLRSTYGWICTSFNLRSQEDAVSHLSHSSFREAHPTCSQQVPTFPLSLKGRSGRQE